MAEHNEQFAIDAEQEGSAFVADTMGAWREILCIQEDRTVGNDNTVKWQRRACNCRRAGLLVARLLSALRSA